jgi:hypothetical protein
MKKRNIMGFLFMILCLAGFAQTTPDNSIIIQAEDFIDYYDTSPGNYDLVYRRDVDVDMNYDHDPYWYEGIRVMAIQTGEELTYTVEVPATDVWDITFNGIINFDLYFDGTLYAAGVGTPLDVRGDFRYNQDILVPGVQLTAGTHTMTIVSNSLNDFGDVQLDYIWFASTTNPPGPPPVAPKPYDDTAPPVSPPGYVSPVSHYGRLYTDGPDIKSTVTGEKVNLRFVAVSSAKWFPTIKNNTIYNLAYHEHVQGIRLAMYAEYGTYDDPFLRPYLREKTLEVINECIDAGIYLEISYHTHATDFEIGGDAWDVEMDFYTWLLDQPVVEAQPPNLIFGIINEIASDSISWNTVKPYAQGFADLIRSSQPENLILCGTPSWCQRPHEVIGNELAGTNIAYTFHLYTAQHEISIADNVIACYDAGVPIWANEISPGHYDWTEWRYNFDNFYQLLILLESRGIPWTNWAWTLKGEALSALYWDSQYYGPWKNSELTEGGTFVRNMIGNYLVYADFSDGAGDWYLHDWQKPAASEVVNEEVHISYPGEISADDYGQQYKLENIPIYQGITYTVSFEARASAPRQVQVDISENDDDYTVYGSSGPLDVTGAMNQYTFSFTMNEATDDSARIVFNVGACRDDIWLDTIVVHYSELPIPKPEKDDCVVLSENFAGETGWTFNPWQPDSPSAEIEYAGDEAHITFLSLAEDPWGQQLLKEISLEQGASYVVRFDARSTAPRPLNVSVCNSSTYVTHGAGDFSISTNMAPYAFRFTMTGEVSENDIIQFNLGTDTHDIWLDNISIVKYNRLLNGDFSLGETGWEFNPWEPSWPSAEIEYTDGQAHITYLDYAPHDYGQQLSNHLRLETGEYYYVSFYARASAPRPLKVLVTNNSYYYPADFIVSTTMEHYEYSFIMEENATGADCLRFDLGADTHDIWLDNVVVRKVDNLVKNGYFSNNSNEWSSGFFEGAEGNAYVLNNEYVFDITNGGSADWNIQLFQLGVVVNQGKRYLVEFEARTDSARDIIVNIGSGEYSNPDPYTSYSGGKTFSLDTEMRRYSFEFTMNEPDHDDARCEFNVGTSESNVMIDNVRIIEIINIYDDFNNKRDPGNWMSNGRNCFWLQFYKRKHIFRVMDIQGPTGAMELRNGFDAAAARSVHIEFYYLAKGYWNTAWYTWDLQFTRDGGKTWRTVYTWSRNNFTRQRCFHFCKFWFIPGQESIILDSKDYHFTGDCNFRFRSHGKNRRDDVFIDDVKISIYR